jgi:transcriptional regulator with XRE-family HTH domain
MSKHSDTLGRHLAHNLAALRQARDLTQTDLAKAAGLPRSTVTNLESGAGNPSLASLSTLADTLQVSIEELLAKPRLDCQLVKATALRARAHDGGRVRIVKLLPDPMPGFELDRMELEPGGWKQGVPHLAGTKEYFTCITGVVTVYVAGDNFVVEPGDVLAFPGDQAHSYRNDGARPSVCFSVVSLAPRQKRRGS